MEILLEMKNPIVFAGEFTTSSDQHVNFSRAGKQPAISLLERWGFPFHRLDMLVPWNATQMAEIGKLRSMDV